jgi:branched-subunit amino acid ABC-type transport system permease component
VDDVAALSDFINLYLMPGLVVGCIYALGAIGISLLFGILRFAHFAHGDMMTLGAYLAIIFTANFGWSPYAALPIAIVGTAIIALGLDRAFYKPFRRSPGIVTVIASFGVMLMLRSAIQLIWGVDVKTYYSGIVFPMQFGMLKIAPRLVIIVLVTAVLVIALHLFLGRTRLGKAMRAVSDDPDLARVSGINVEQVVRWTWIVGAGLAAAGGVFIGMQTKVHPSMGWDLLLPLFAAAVLGGIGRPYGAVAGGLAIGLAQELATYPWFSDDPFIAPGYKPAVAFSVMVIMLIWRPTGLFRGRVF